MITIAPNCDSIPIHQRSDCWPQGTGASQQSCAAKDCCWDPVKNGSVPQCFYPSNYQGYIVQSSKWTPTGMSYTLTRNSSSGWPADIKTLTLDVIYETQQRLHFKVCLTFFFLLHVLLMGGSRKFHHFLVVNVFHRGPYEPPFRSNWTPWSSRFLRGSVPEFLRKPIATCGFPGGGGGGGLDPLSPTLEMSMLLFACWLILHAFCSSPECSK